jgi:hypothetical protein
MELYYPGAIRRLIPPGDNDPAIIPIGIIWHTDAGDSKSLYGYFNGPSGGIESHLHFPKVGAPEQYRDFGHEADANYHANSFLINGKRYGFISGETQGLATDLWNAHQLTEMKKFMLWARANLHVALSKCVGPYSPGVGWHTMWGSPGPWTPYAKDCPGKPRIGQFTNDLVPWMKSVTSAAGSTGQPGGETMDAKDVQLLLDTVIRADGLTVRQALAGADFASDQLADGGNLQQTVKKIAADLATVKEKVGV